MFWRLYLIWLAIIWVIMAGLPHVFYALWSFLEWKLMWPGIDWAMTRAFIVFSVVFAFILSVIASD